LESFLEYSQQYQLGPWVICPQTNTITNKNDIRSIDNKSMQVLLFLIQQARKKVTKDQIFEHVWKGKFVADDILSVTVSKIRKALGDNARSPIFIKTLSGEGYILIAQVKKINSTEQLSNIKIKHSSLKLGVLTLSLVVIFTIYFTLKDKVVPSNQIKINSIAVLPFDDLSPNQDNQHFTDGLSDAIINELSQLKQLKVISRYSSFTYRGKYSAAKIGQALQVDTLLDGSVQTMGKQVRTNVRIFSTKNGQQLWSKTFDSDAQNSFKLQDTISATIQQIIQPGYSPISKLSKTINTQAYEWYLMGQYHWRQRNPKSLTKAVTYFKHSLDLEPDYAEAHVGLGITYAFLHTYGNWSEEKAIEKALPHILKALALQPNSPTALAAKGMILSDKAKYKADMGEVDASLYQQAQQAFLNSLELESNATTHRWYSSLLSRFGKESEAIQHMNQAIKLNPLSASLKISFSFLLQSIGKQDSAQRMYQQALNLEPDSFSRFIESAKMNRHTQKSLLGMAAWQVANPELFKTCSSVEYCEQLVLSYLSIEANNVADKLQDTMAPSHAHFRHWVNAIIASNKGNELNALTSIKRLVPENSINRKALFDLAVAQYRAAEFGQAKTGLLQLYPEWSNEKSIVFSDVTADNYSALLLYAVTLSNLNEKEFAESLLRYIHTFLKQDEIFDKIQAEFTMAEINAQLNNIPQAIIHLASVLDKGWIETYNKEWWSLQNNHFFQPLNDEPEFQLLLKEHQKKLYALREKITRKLNNS
jgi:TolB-like protein/DNA-binding winged helix-turn-helix (wHTH) protein